MTPVTVPDLHLGIFLIVFPYEDPARISGLLTTAPARLDFKEACVWKRRCSALRAHDLSCHAFPPSSHRVALNLPRSLQQPFAMFSRYRHTSFYRAFICFTALHRCHVFYQSKAKPSTSKEHTTLLTAAVWDRTRDTSEVRPCLHFRGTTRAQRSPPKVL